MMLSVPIARPLKRQWRGLAIALLTCAGASNLTWTDPALAAESVAVSVVNASRTTRCAEEDNIYVKLLGPQVGTFRIRAQHPPYISLVQTDSTAPDFTACDMSQDPSYPFAPRTVLLHEDADIRLVGHSFPTFWRPDVVDFVVNGRTESGLHLVQLIRRRAQGEVEVLVVYPADGYWRVKPLPPQSLPDTAYGSSFLFGPIEESSRPFVAIRRIGFDPSTLTFRLEFRDGTRGMLSVAEASPVQTLLALTIDPALPESRPFAALRSMYVSPAQADVSMASWRADASAMAVAPILGFGRVNAPSVRFGRVEPSRHNLSAPDLVFEEFAASTSR
ncbi:MAG: hypothetical protein KAY46_08490 [Burkholderiaceae bacterium]|nr:hypothetical protein [Burkholderiaceae bacterium]